MCRLPKRVGRTGKPLACVGSTARLSSLRTFALDLHACQLDQLWIDHLLCLLQYIDQIARFRGIVRGEERVGCASVIAPSRAPNAMNVVLRGGREVKVDYKLYVVHVCTA